MRRYRTEIDVPPDHYVCLQLPPHFPVGRATVTVYFNDPSDPPDEGADDAASDREDIEWWEEFEGERGAAETR